MKRPQKIEADQLGVASENGKNRTLRVQHH